MIPTESQVHAHNGAVLAAMAKANMHLLLEDDYTGRHAFKVVSIESAASLYRKWVESSNLGASEISFGKVVKGKKLLATISYNGKIQLES